MFFDLDDADNHPEAVYAMLVREGILGTAMVFDYEEAAQTFLTSQAFHIRLKARG